MMVQMQSTIRFLEMLLDTQRDRFAEKSAAVPDANGAYAEVLEAQKREILTSIVSLCKRIEGLNDHVLHLNIARLLHVRNTLAQQK